MNEDAIRAFRDLDAKRVGVAFAGVVLEQPGAETAGFDADGVVDGGIVRLIALEDVDGDAVLLELFVGMSDRVVKDVAEEELTAMRAAEGAGAEDALQLCFQWAGLGQRRDWKAAQRGPRGRRGEGTRLRAEGRSWHGVLDALSKVVNLQAGRRNLRAQGCYQPKDWSNLFGFSVHDAGSRIEESLFYAQPG